MNPFQEQSSSRLLQHESRSVSEIESGVGGGGQNQELSLYSKLHSLPSNSVMTRLQLASIGEETAVAYFKLVSEHG